MLKLNLMTSLLFIFISFSNAADLFISDSQGARKLSSEELLGHKAIQTITLNVDPEYKNP